jgi:integrase
MALTDTKIKQAQPLEKMYRLYDKDGLYLQVQPNGSKYWRWKYRFGGKEKVLALGVYSSSGKHLSLKEARIKRQSAYDLLRQNIDPSSAKRLQKLVNTTANEDTFGNLSQKWFSKQSNTWAPATAKKNRALLDNDILPFLSPRPIDAIETWELMGILNRITERGAIDTAHKCRQIMNQVFRHAKQIGRTKQNPAIDLVGALPARNTKHRAAITDPAKFAQLLLDIDRYKGTPITRTMLALAPLLFQRPSELASMEWSELDLKDGYWNIPKAKKKERNKREGDHLVPLPLQAIELIKELEPLTGNRQFVFPNQRDPKKHANPESINKALRIMGYDTGKDQCFHGFRASARTMLDEQLGLRVEWIEHQLAHTVKDALGRAYNRTKHLPERIDMMERWGRYLDELKRQALSGNIISVNFKSNRHN